MSKIVSIGTAVPRYKHDQEQIFEFMHRAYALNEQEKRKLKYLYRHGGIKTRYSVLPDYSLPASEWTFFPGSENLEPFPSLEKRMDRFRREAAPLSILAIKDCLKDVPVNSVTHLITVSCTGISAPGLELELMEMLNLPPTTWRTAVNFMGCYAAIHALKLADHICRSEKNANVLIVCTECCTLHLQKDYIEDNITSGLLFGDGSAAVLVCSDAESGLTIESFYSCVTMQAKKEMVWDLSSKGFVLTLSGYIPELIEENFDQLVCTALEQQDLQKKDITHWCMHPGGKKILEAIHKSLGFSNGQLQMSYDILSEYGNMSSPTILFVLDRICQELDQEHNKRIFGAAFGPGLTMETFILSS